MHITLNGQPFALPDADAHDAPMTVADLVAHRGLAETICAVEVNRAVVPRRDRATHTLADGDTVEIVTLVGGG